MEQITVTELATLADIDRKTFYLYYDTLNDIYKEIEQGIIEGLQILLSEKEIHDWKTFLIGLTEIMEKDLEFYTVIVENTDYVFLANNCTNILTNMLCQSLLSNAKRNSVEANMMVKYAVAGILGVYSDWLKSKERIPLEKLIDVLGNAMNNSLADYKL